MTPKNRKTLYICIGIVIAIYVVRSMAISRMQMVNYQRALQQRALQQQKAKLTSAKPAAPPIVPAKQPTAPSIAPIAPVVPEVAAPVVPAIPPELASLQGIWRGRAALRGHGICDLRFELTEKESDPGKFSGYSALTCNGSGPLVSRGPANGARETIDRLSPEAAILTGTPDKGAITFTVDKIVGTDADGCAPKDFSLTPFGRGQLDAEWQEEQCAGGHIILRKFPR